MYKIANIAKNVPVISMKNKTLIILPAYNEELTIGSVVALAKKFGDVLVVDDASCDRTSQIFLHSFKGLQKLRRCKKLNPKLL